MMNLGEKITTIKIKRDLVGDSKVDDLINQYKDVDILVIVGDIEKIMMLILLQVEIILEVIMEWIKH